MLGWTIIDSGFYNSPPDKGAVYPHAAGYLEKEIHAGGNLYIELYPYWNTKPAEVAEAVKVSTTRAAQRMQNERNARKRFIQLLNCNFGNEDYHLTLTYNDTGGPLPGIDEVQRDIRNFIRRWQRQRRAAGLGKGKYMYVIEGADNGEKRIHAHIIMTGGLIREQIEDTWPYGYANADRLQPDESGLEGLGRYLTKDPKGKKRWGGSKGLIQPEIYIRPCTLSHKEIADIERDRYSAQQHIAARYPGYYLSDPERSVEVRTSPFVAGSYISVRLTKAEVRKGGRKGVSGKIQIGYPGRTKLRPYHDIPRGGTQKGSGNAEVCISAGSGGKAERFTP